MKFRYTARTRTGELQAGFVEGLSRENAFSILTAHNLYILSLEKFESSPFEPIAKFFRRVKRSDIMVFTRQLATMLEAGISLGDALRGLYDQTKSVTLREIILEISLDVDSGLSLSQSLDRHSDIFSEFYVSLIRTAEVTGRIEESMVFLADHLEKEMTLLNRIRNALIYPAFVVGLFIVVSFILLAFVFPQIEPIFTEANVAMPLLTRVLIAVGNFLAHWWLVVIFVMIALVSIIIDYFRGPEGRTVMSQIIFTLPVFGNIFRKIYVIRFASAVSILLRGGIPISQAIVITSRNIQNALYSDALDDAASSVARGEPLSAALSRHSRYFPVLVVQMMAVGESTGRLSDMLDRTAKFYSREVDSLISELVELVQPAIMVIVGVMVGLLFASLLLPIYNLAETGF